MRNALLLMVFTPPLFACCCCGGCNLPVPPPPGPGQPTVSTEPSRLDARFNSVDTNELNISIPTALVAPVKYELQGRIETSTRDYLQIHLRAKNRLPRQAVEFPGWGQQEGLLSGAVLTDNLGTRYPQSEFPRGSRVVGRARSTQIEPGGISDDNLFFGEPAAGATELYLDLPLPNGQTARFVIPMSMVVRKK